MLLEILRFIRGSVGFSVSGRYPERFINITSRKGIRIWDVRRCDDGFNACMYRSDYRRIRTPARGAGVRLKISSKKGLPTYIRKYRDRVGVLVGACAFIISVFVMSLFIWSIDISGQQTVSQSDMREVLREHGLYVGAFKPLLDYQRISRDILLERHEIGWMAVNVTGSYASVEIKEEAQPPKVEDVSSPCNIKAKHDGVILRIEAHEGETVMTEGSGVIEGQLVVSGVKVDEQGSGRLVHADAKVVARTTRAASFSTPKSVSFLRPSGESVRRKSLDIFGLDIPYSFGNVSSPYSVMDESTEAAAPLDITLPVGITTQKIIAMETVDTDLDENSAEELLLREAAVYEAFAMSDCTIEAREQSLSFKNGVYTMNVVYTCVEDIAYSEPIGTDENTDLTRYISPTESEGED